MGFLQAAISHMNRMFGDPEFLRANREQILELYKPPENGENVATIARNTQQMLGDESALGEGIRNVAASDVAKIIEDIPSTILEAQRAVVHANLQRDEPFGMTFAWAPGYDHEVTIWESPPTANTPGWITVLVKGRHPKDKHPITGRG